MKKKVNDLEIMVTKTNEEKEEPINVEDNTTIKEELSIDNKEEKHIEESITNTNTDGEIESLKSENIEIESENKNLETNDLITKPKKSKKKVKMIDLFCDGVKYELPANNPNIIKMKTLEEAINIIILQNVELKKLFNKKKRILRLIKKECKIEESNIDKSDIEIIDNFALDENVLKINSLNEEISELKLKIDELINSCNEKDLLIQQLKEELVNVQEKEEPKVIQESVFNIEQFNELSENYEDLQKKYLELTLNKELLEQTIIQKTNDLNEYEEKNKNYQIQVDDLQHNLDKIIEQRHDDETVISQQKLNITNYEMQIASLKETINSEKNENKKLQDLLDEKIVTKNNDDNSYYLSKLEEQQQINNDLGRTIEAYKISLGSKTEEIINLKAEIQKKQELISQLEFEKNINNNKSIDDNKRLENRIDELSLMIEKLSNQKNQPLVNDYHYEQERQIRLLRDEINSKFEEQKKDRYFDEMRKLKDEFASISRSMLDSKKDDVVIKGVVNKEITNVQNQLTSLEDKIENKTEQLNLIEKSQGIKLSKEDIKDPQFFIENNKLEKSISQINYEISLDNDKFNAAINKNNLAIDRRYGLISEINDNLDLLAENYQQSSDKKLNYKDLYDQEKIKATEKIRFHEEKIRELLASNSDASIKHEEYLFEKKRQIEVLKNKQNQLLEFYALKQQGVLNNEKEDKQLLDELGKLRKEHEVKTDELVNLNKKMAIQYDKSDFEKKPLELEKYVQPNSSSSNNITFLKGKEDEVIYLRRSLEEIRSSLNKFKNELDKRMLLENEMKKDDETIAEYYRYSSSVQSLMNDLSNLKKQKMSINERIDNIPNNPNNSNELNNLKQQLEEISVREQDVYSKINYTNKKLGDLSNDLGVSRYKELIKNMEAIQDRMSNLKNKYIATKNTIEKKEDELKNYKQEINLKA